jgi:uncharacterized protein (TIGR02996 family)
MVAAVARFEKGDKVFEITSGDGRYTTELRKHMREGWARVPDPRCEVPLGAEPINPTLEEALRAEPNDSSAALVYADWLEQQGHPRGALIAVQHRLSLDPRDAELTDAERTIFAQSGDSLVSRALLAHLSIERNGHETALSRSLSEGGTISFDHGFIRSARLNMKRRGIDEDVLWELLRHPSARALASLNIKIDKSRDSALVATMLTHGARPPLRWLHFTVEHKGMTVDLSGLDAAFPLLEDLQLTIHNVRLGSLELPRVKRLAVLADHSDIGLLLATRTWPELEALWLMGEHDKLRLAFERPSFPKLHTLSLQLRPGSDEDPTYSPLSTVRMLVRSPNVGQLRTLELPIELPAEAITLLVENRAKFAQLETMRVGARYVERLVAAGFPVSR